MNHLLEMTRRLGASRARPPRQSSGRRLGWPRRRKSLPGLLATVAVSLCSALPATAAAAVPIEGDWSFNGGEVAIQPKAGGTFVGTVISPTKFAQCSHPVGEQMWMAMTPQPDGSYWGLHQWFFETLPCVHNPMLGPTAWRVMETSSGAHYLLVCFSDPGSAQPTIAPSGAEANVSYGCFESARTASLSVQSFSKTVTLPGTRKCFSHRVFQIHIRDPRRDPLKEVVVTIHGRQVAVVRRGGTFAATINLKGLPRGTFTVNIHATTVLGHHLDGRRTYHTCVKRILTPRKPGSLHPKKHAHG